MRSDPGILRSVIPIRDANPTKHFPVVTLALIAANVPLAVQAVKASVQAGEGLTERDALKKELELGWPILSTEDAKEGPRAFAEKRPPNFRGR